MLGLYERKNKRISKVKCLRVIKLVIVVKVVIIK